MQHAELTRLLRMETNWARLLFVPAVALLILYLLSLSEDDDADHRFWFLLSAAGWGSFSVVWSVKEEFNNRTWLWQQLLPLSPAQLLSGRLLAVLALPWLGGLLLLSPILPTLLAVEAMLTAAVANAAALFLALITVRDDKANMAVPLLATVAGVTFLTGLPSLTAGDELIAWHHFLLPQQPFAIASLALYLCWTLAGCHQLLARAKHAPAPAWLFPLFLLFHAFYCSGFSRLLFTPNESDWLVHFYSLICWGVFWSALYASAFLCGSGGLLLFIDNARRRAASWRQLPPWLWALAGMLLAAIGVIVFDNDKTFNAWLVTAMTLLALRDMAILLLFTLRKGKKLPEGIALVVLITLYVPLPLALDETGLGIYWMMPHFAYVAEPQAMLHLTALSAAAQSAAALTLLWKMRLQRYFKTTPQP